MEGHGARGIARTLLNCDVTGALLEKGTSEFRCRLDIQAAPAAVVEGLGNAVVLRVGCTHIHVGAVSNVTESPP